MVGLVYGAWGSGAIIGTTAPEIGHALPQTVAVLTSGAGQSISENIIFSIEADAERAGCFTKRQLQLGKENVGGSTRAMKHKNGAILIFMMAYL